MSERAMTAPRQFLPETTYLVTRRTERRHHLFRPDAVMSQSFLYCLAFAASRSGVVIHCACLLSNHYHVVLHDVRGRAPLFTEILNGLLTKCTQAHRGWSGRVLDGQGPSYVELLTDDATIDKIGYTLVNATATGLVRFAREWPGVRTRVDDIGALVLTVARPGAFFVEDGIMPERIELRFEMPKRLLDAYGSVESARAAIAAEHERQEQQARLDIERQGRRFMGRRRVLEVSPYARAKTYEERGCLNPHFAGDAEAIKTAIARHHDFLDRYHDCRANWCAHRRHMIWPEGTYLMRRVHNVRVADPPA